MCRVQRTNGVISKKPVETHPRYMVSQVVALELLAKRDQSAANYWHTTGAPKSESCFAFRAEEVEEVEPVSPRM